MRAFFSVSLGARAAVRENMGASYVVLGEACAREMFNKNKIARCPAAAAAAAGVVLFFSLSKLVDISYSAPLKQPTPSGPA